MRVRVGSWSASGEAVDCRGRDVDASALEAAIGRGATTAPLAGNDESRVRVSCPTPGVVFEHVGVVSPSQSVDLRAALAAAARTRDVAVAGEDELADAREQLAGIDVPEVDLTGARERVARAREAEASVHADVAAARGMVAAREDLDADVDPGRERLREAVATASERETERIAAEQALSRERERAREARDARERRMTLADRVGRLERDVRDRRVDAVWGAFADAVAAVPGPTGNEDDGESAPPSVDPEPGSFAGDDATAALAIARVADGAAPVVVAVDRFASAADAAAVLDAPVVLAAP